ncbi:DUF4254 domain-containing protein [Nocardia wallacei]|uniref:DUF4254 domain-containing protein n=1 Tax=Nocardia wallacei TaxID=480035 RepID=UPI0024555B82|nr:DUF4254 domain-containing protein [Nocardia wallacei]
MELFPPKNHMLAACRGDTGRDHVLLRCAKELGELHERRLAEGAALVAQIDTRRSELRASADCWVHDRLPPSHGCARVHTEGLGSVIDRLAEFTARAYAALAGATEWDLFDAWETLAELGVAYEDLTAEVTTGHRRLPGGN